MEGPPNLKGRNVGTVVNGDGIAMCGGKGDEGREIPVRDFSRRGIIEAINLINISRKGGELEDLGADGRGRRSKPRDPRDLHSSIRIHREE